MNPSEYATMRAVEDRHWWYRGLRRLVLDQLAEAGQPESAPLLDVGCGTGGMLSLLPQKAVGIDLASEALALAQGRGSLRVAQADAQSLPFADNTFSGLLLLDVLYHRAAPDKLALLKEVQRVMRTDGLVILNAPAYQWLYSSHDVAIHTDRRFTAHEIRTLLAEAGFKPMRVTYWNTLLFPAAVAVRLLRRGGPRDTSDLEGYREGLGTWVAGMALATERRWMRHASLPFGLSIFAVAKKT